MSVLEKIDKFLMEDNKAAGLRAASKFKKLPKKFAQVIKEQDEDYAEDLFSRMADFISQIDVSDLPDELVLMRNEIIAEIYPGEEEPFDDDDFTGGDVEDADAEDVAADDFEGDFGDEADEPEEVEDNEDDFYESKKLRALFLEDQYSDRVDSLKAAVNDIKKAMSQEKIRKRREHWLKD